MIFTFTINGIGESAKRTTDRFAEELRKTDEHVHALRYPTVQWWSSRDVFKQQLYARQAIKGIRRCVQAVVGDEQPTINIVAHSHGCLITSRMLEQAQDGFFGSVFLFAPAMDAKWIWPEGSFSKLYVISNPNDRALLFARLFPFKHRGGAMGRTGYVGSDTRVTQVFDTTKEWPRSHSHYFKKPHLEKWVEYYRRRSEDGGRRTEVGGRPPEAGPPLVEMGIKSMSKIRMRRES